MSAYKLDTEGVAWGGLWIGVGLLFLGAAIKAAVVMHETTRRFEICVENDLGPEDIRAFLERTNELAEEDR